jgi:hypothetical protein
MGVTVDSYPEGTAFQTLYWPLTGCKRKCGARGGESTEERSVSVGDRERERESDGVDLRGIRDQSLTPKMIKNRTPCSFSSRRVGDRCERTEERTDGKCKC